VGIAAVPGAVPGVLAQEPQSDPDTPTTTTTTAPDPPAADPTPPAAHDPSPSPPSPPSPPSQSTQPPPPPPPPPAAAAPPASRLYTPPVGAPLDFARDPLPAFDVPPERRHETVAPPPRESTLGRIIGEEHGDDADENDAADAAEGAAGGALAGALAPSSQAAGIPNFFIGHFAIPPFLLSIYQAAGIQYGVPWEVLAAINEIETDFGRNVNVSSAGATGWMQFMPASWQTYGVDANADGRKDPYNPVDAIFAAARYLKAAGAGDDLRKAIFAYNHADWYVEAVLNRARFMAGLPSDLVGSLTGLTQGRSPIAARMTYTHRAPRSAPRRELRIQAPAGSVIVAVQDGRIMRVGSSPRLGRYVVLRDAYGNTYTYAHVGKLARNVLVAKEQSPARPARAVQPITAPPDDPVPVAPASAGSNGAAAQAGAASTAAGAANSTKAGPPTPPASASDPKERLFANPARTRSLASGGRRQILDATFALPASASLRSYFAGDVGLERDELQLKRLFTGRRVIAGTILGRVGSVSTSSTATQPHVLFSIRPPGRGVPRIDPEPFLEGWRLLESTNIFRARGAGALAGGSIGQILLMSKDTLAKRVLANPDIDIYACGRRDILAGVVDRRVLATLEFLAANGLKPTVSSIRCGHRFFTETGNVSQHSSGNGVDIAKINGQAILGSQGPGSITDVAVRRLLTLQGTMAPAQIISLMSYPGAPTALAMPDHADHIHIGFRPMGNASGAGVHAMGLRPKQWLRLVDRLGRIANPVVSRMLRRP
jgi:soluble lytic murein transglycosylase-like protein